MQRKMTIGEQLANPEGFPDDFQRDLENETQPVEQTMIIGSPWRKEVMAVLTAAGIRCEASDGHKYLIVCWHGNLRQLQDIRDTVEAAIETGQREALENLP